MSQKAKRRLDPIEMLWYNHKQAIHAQEPSSVAELKHFCKEEWFKISPKLSKRLIASYCKPLIAVLVIRFREQLLFLTVQSNFGYCFPLINKIIIQKLHFVITRVIFVCTVYVNCEYKQHGV